MGIGVLSAGGAFLGASLGAAFERVVVENVPHIAKSALSERLSVCMGTGAVIGALTGGALHLVRKTASVARNTIANGAVSGAVSLFTAFIPLGCAIEEMTRRSDQESLVRFLFRFGRISFVPTLIGGLLGGVTGEVFDRVMSERFQRA